MLGWPWRYVCASVKGTSHAISGLPCQDASLVTPIASDDPILIATIADGAGSAAEAATGARLVCSTFAELMIGHFARGGKVGDLAFDLTSQYITEVIERLKVYAYGAELPLRDLASTFVAGVASSRELMCLQIGDGAIVVNDGEGYRAAFWPQSGEYVNTTFFLTDDSALTRLQHSLTQSAVDEIGCFTDGLQMLALRYSAKEVHVPFFRPLFERLRMEEPGESDLLTQQLTDWLDSQTINSRTDDDKTLLLASRRLVS